VIRRRRNVVLRADGRPVNVARPRGQLFVCASGCCCGRTEDGFAPVPADLYHAEWERRGLRNVVHLTIGGCLGPCALANVVLLLLDGQALWFHSINTGELVLALYEYIERRLAADRDVPPPSHLAACQFTASAWQPRPDGQPVDDRRPHHPAPRLGAAAPPPPPTAGAGCRTAPVERLVARMNGAVAPPRRNGELTFEAPWQGRAFGMAVALSEQALYAWDEFREELIRAVAEAEARADGFAYYEVWVETFERLLRTKGLVTREELDERTYQFEFGERDDVY